MKLLSQRAFLYATKDGLEVAYAAVGNHHAFFAARQRSGVAFATGAFLITPTPAGSGSPSPTPFPAPTTAYEDRFTVAIYASDEPGAHLISVSVNPEGACVVGGFRVVDTDHSACKGTNDPKTIAALASVKCDLADDAFCGEVVIDPDVLMKHIHFSNGMLSYVLLCAAFSDGPVAALSDKTDPPARAWASGANSGGCIALSTVLLADGSSSDPYQRRAWYSLSEANTSSTTTNAASPAPTASGGNGLNVSAAGVYPLSYRAQVSGSIQNVNTSFITQKYSQLLGSVPTPLPQGAIGEPSSTPAASASPGALPVAWTQDDFSHLDTTPFEQIVEEPSRDGTWPFNGVHTAMVPFDFENYSTWNYGGKALWHDETASAGAAYYRDYDPQDTGTIIHADSELGQVPFNSAPGDTEKIGWLDVGATESVISRAAPAVGSDSNVYVTRLHSDNVVYEATLSPYSHSDWRLFYRGATVDTGSDHMLGISYMPENGGRIISDAGATQYFHGSAGYRNVDSGYDPLGTPYDVFTGTRYGFGSAGSTWAFADGSTSDVSVQGGDATDSTSTRYWFVGESVKWTIGGQNALTVSHVASQIAADVFGKQGGKYYIVGKQGTQMLANGISSAAINHSGVWGSRIDSEYKLQLQYNAASSPTTCSTSAKLNPCQDAFKYSLTGEGEMNGIHRPWLVDLKEEPASQIAGKTTSGSLTNQTNVTGLFQVCFAPLKGTVHVQPFIDYDNNTAQTSSTYTPGNLFETGIEARPSGWLYMFQVGYKGSFDERTLPNAQAVHAFAFQVVSINSTVAATTDSCQQAASSK